MNLIKKLKKPNQNTKNGQKSIKNPRVGSGLALNLNAHQKQVQHQGRGLNWD
jgi:hypothetical protein